MCAVVFTFFGMEYWYFVQFVLLLVELQREKKMPVNLNPIQLPTGQIRVNVVFPWSWIFRVRACLQKIWCNLSFSCEWTKEREREKHGANTMVNVSSYPNWCAFFFISTYTQTRTLRTHISQQQHMPFIKLHYENQEIISLIFLFCVSIDVRSSQSQCTPVLPSNK